MNGLRNMRGRDIRLSRTQTLTFSNKTRHYPLWDEVKFINRIVLKGNHTTFLVQLGLNLFALVSFSETSNFDTFLKFQIDLEVV